MKTNRGRRAARLLGPVLLAAALFTLNNLGLFHAWRSAPPGTVALNGYHIEDIAMYEVWLRGFQHSLTVENFAVPWPTEPAFFHPLFFLAARLSNVLGTEPLLTTLGIQFLCYIAAAWGLFFGFRVFLEDRAQRWVAAALILCSVPVASLLVVPSLLAGRSWPLPGIGFFVWSSSDGFYHGIGGSVLVTFGTAAALIALGLIGAYLRGGKSRRLAWAAMVTFAVAYVHANEALLICAASFAAVVVRPPKERLRAMRDMLPVWLSAGLGLFLLIIPTLRHPWLRQLAEHSRGDRMALTEVLGALGLPAFVCLLLLLRRARSLTSGSDVLLAAWFVSALGAAALPLLPTPQHFLDGFHYVSGILLARLLFTEQPDWLRGARRVPALAALGVCCVLSLPAYLAYCRQGYLDGATLTPRRLFSAVASIDEVNLLAWFRANADSNDVVLAPPSEAPFVATVPIHSIGAHWLWGRDAELAEGAGRFFKGTMSCEDATAFLSRYGVRYVVINDKVAGRDCRPESRLRTSFGALRIYDAYPVRADAK